MNDLPNDRVIELIDKLHKGKMLGNSMIKSLVDQGLKTANWRPLEEYLERYPFLLSIAENNIRQSIVDQLDNPFMPYPDSDDVREYLSGEINIGFVNKRDQMFGMHWNMFCLPTIVPGRVGSGKSILLKYLLNQLLNQDTGANIIIADLKKEYRDLLNLNQNIRVLTKDMIFVNPLEVPEWSTPKDHMVFFSKVFSRETWVGSLSENELKTAVDELYKKRGIYEGSTNYPTLLDLHIHVSAKLNNQKSFHFRDILQKLQGNLNDCLIAEIFNCQRGIPDDTWRTENLVLELDNGISDHVYSFLIWNRRS